jgi:hypothetical protein
MLSPGATTKHVYPRDDDDENTAMPPVFETSDKRGRCNEKNLKTKSFHDQASGEAVHLVADGHRAHAGDLRG